MSFGEREGDAPAVGNRSPFADSLLRMLNFEDLEEISESQEQMLSRFEKTNAKLDSFNDISEAKFEAVSAKFRDHTRLLLEAKRDLHSVFRRIRILKDKLSKQHPVAFGIKATPKWSTAEDYEDDKEVSHGGDVARAAEQSTDEDSSEEEDQEFVGETAAEGSEEADQERKMHYDDARSSHGDGGFEGVSSEVPTTAATKLAPPEDPTGTIAQALTEHVGDDGEVIEEVNDTSSDNK